MRLSPVPSASRVAVPVSLSDPAVQVTLPVRVASPIVVPPVSAEMDAAAKAKACGSLGGSAEFAAQRGETTRAKMRRETVLYTEPPQRASTPRSAQQVGTVNVVNLAVKVIFPGCSRAAVDEEPFSKDGGFQRLNKVFGGQLEAVLGDINEEVWRQVAA
jgi:hypothetical protein